VSVGRCLGGRVGACEGALVPAKAGRCLRGRVGACEGGWVPVRAGGCLWGRVGARESDALCCYKCHTVLDSGKTTVSLSSGSKV